MSIMSDLILVGASLFELSEGFLFFSASVFAMASSEKNGSIIIENTNKNLVTAMKKLNIKFDLSRFIFAIISCLIVVFIILQTSKTPDTELAQFNRDIKNYNVKLQILNHSETKIAQFFTAIADDENERMTGLMDLDFLPENQAMIFIFDQDAIMSMWMKNTRIPLDMLFIDKNDRIVNIKRNTKPYSLDIISSEKSVAKVLEINGGLSEKIGIKIGQKINLLPEKIIQKKETSYENLSDKE